MSPKALFLTLPMRWPKPSSGRSKTALWGGLAARPADSSKMGGVGGCGAAKVPLLLVHGLWCSKADLVLLDPASHFLIACPGSHMRYAFPARWADWHAAGLTVTKQGPGRQGGGREGGRGGGGTLALRSLEPCPSLRLLPFLEKTKTTKKKEPVLLCSCLFAPHSSCFEKVCAATDCAACSIVGSKNRGGHVRVDRGGSIPIAILSVCLFVCSVTF